MGIFSAVGEPPSSLSISVAVESVRAGRVIALPTDTVYGLAADPGNSSAIERLFALKNRPRDVELPVLVSDVAQAMSLTTAVPPVAEQLMRHFWPGALTLVLPRNPDIFMDLGSDDLTVGIRCPDHAVARELCRLAGPLATTSANIHGQPTLTSAKEVADTFGDRVPVILDGGRCDGASSTVVDCTGEVPKVLREGGISWFEIEATLQQ